MSRLCCSCCNALTDTSDGRENVTYDDEADTDLAESRESERVRGCTEADADAGIGAVSISGDDPDTVCAVTAVVGLDVDSANGEEAARTVVIDAREASDTLRRLCLSAREDLRRNVSDGSGWSGGGVESGRVGL